MATLSNMESNASGIDPTDAAAQLAALSADRRALAERVQQPWWYDAALGLVVFVLLAPLSTRNSWVILGGVAVGMAGLAWLRSAYTRITGVWVNGLRPGPTRRAIHAWLVLYAVVLAAAACAEFLLDVRGGMVVGAAVLGVGIALISRWWTRIYVAELRSPA
jgi:hypothetical protein